MRANYAAGTFGSLPGVQYWHYRLTEECARADRFVRSFVLVLLELSGSDASGGAVAVPAEGAMAVSATSLQQALRGSDGACRLSFSRWGILLTETTCSEGEQALRRLQRLLHRDLARALPATALPFIYAASACYGVDGTTPEQLAQAAEQALHQQLQSGAVHGAGAG